MARNAPDEYERLFGPVGKDPPDAWDGMPESEPPTDEQIDQMARDFGEQ
jgi:hypothetical protein